DRANGALQNIYEPGSTFKIVAYSAAIEKNLVTPADKIDCQMGQITVAGRLIHDGHPYGVLTVADALAKSSNVAAIKLGLLVGNESIYDFAKRLGFGSRTGIDLPGESRGILEGVTLRGTAKKAQVEGYSAAGKTGTAQKIDPKTHTYSSTKFIGSFVGFAPVNNPTVVIIVVIDEPQGAYHGGDVAAPVFR